MSHSKLQPSNQANAKKTKMFAAICICTYKFCLTHNVLYIYTYIYKYTYHSCCDGAVATSSHQMPWPQSHAPIDLSKSCPWDTFQHSMRESSGWWTTTPRLQYLGKKPFEALLPWIKKMFQNIHLYICIHKYMFNVWRGTAHVQKILPNQLRMPTFRTELVPHLHIYI